LEYSLPAGYYYEEWGGSIGYGGAVCFSVTHNLGVRFGASKIGMIFDDDFYLVSTDPEFSVVSQDLSMSAWRYYVAAQYYSFLDHSKEDLSMYYLYAGFAGVSHKRTIEAELLNSISGLTRTDRSEVSETKVAIVWGFGVTTMVSTSIGLDFGLDWDMVAVDSHETRRFGLESRETDFSHIFNFRAGLVLYALGK
jgi:opacity protein-like surface antigen